MAIQRNAGIDPARGDVVVFIDDDCTIDPGMFAALSAAYEDPTVVGVIGRIRRPPRGGVVAEPEPDSRVRSLILGGGRQGTMSSFGFGRPIIDVEEPRDVEYMPGPLMSARRDLAAEVRFDERLTAYALGKATTSPIARLVAGGSATSPPPRSNTTNSAGRRWIDARSTVCA